MNTEQKQSINLSNYAVSVLKEDMQQFNPSQSYNGFLNDIIERYSDYADASITAALIRQRSRLESALEQNVQFSETLNPEQKNQLIHLLDEDTKAHLLNMAKQFESGETFSFRLNNRNRQKFFPEDGSKWPDLKYYGGYYSRYFKALLEEYCERPRFRREEIYFQSFIDAIHEAISSAQKVRVSTESPFSESGREIWDVRPYALLSDESHLYHYLVGKSVKAGGLRHDEKIASIRLSRIRDIRILSKKTNHSGMLTAVEKKEIRQKIAARSVSFLLGDECEVIVRFTDFGKKMFENTLFMRPYLLRIDENGYFHFQCTKVQAARYFIRFGEDAEVLAPEDLRKEFAQVYQRAAERYTNNPAITR